MTTVGIVANPQSGKDLRRLTSAAGQVSDGAKIDVVRQVTLAALEAGADDVLLAADRSDIAARAIDGLGSRTELIDGPATGSRHDSVDAAKTLASRGVSVVVGLGGDGTCRDLATGWPGLPLIAMSTGTNNVFPQMLNPTAAGLAAGSIASGRVHAADVAEACKRIVVTNGDSVRYALVDIALVDTFAVGARAVTDAATLRWVLACRAEPTSTGLSAIAARAGIRTAADDGALFVRLGATGRAVRVPLSPGSFDEVAIAAVEPVAEGQSIDLTGRGVLAFDGERECLLESGATATVDRLGPRLVDVAATLHRALSPHEEPDPQN